MPKVATSLSALMRQWIAPYNTQFEVFSSNGKTVTCLVCGKDIACQRKFQVVSHASAACHVAAFERYKNSKLRQSKITDSLSAAESHQFDKTEFNKQLCNAFVSADIPLHKLENNTLKSFLEKYTQKHIPNESTLRKNYIPQLHKETMHKIRASIGENLVYVIVDETTDVKGNAIANLIIGNMLPSQAGSPYLIAATNLEKCNAENICTFINDTLNSFYQGKRYSDKVVLFISDAAPYMVRAGNNLKCIFKLMIHVTCVAHGINRICEKFREIFPDVNSLISCARKVFLKSPARIQLYKDIMGCPLPPDVVITRWGTWLEAAEFFAEKLELFSEVVEKLENDSVHVGKIKTLLMKAKNIPLDLAFLKAHAVPLVTAIKKLEKRRSSLNDQVQIIEDILQEIKTIPGERGAHLIGKARTVFGKNLGYTKLRLINEAVVNGVVKNEIEDIIKNPNLLAAYTFAPLTSTDIERSFSTYKRLLTDRRHNFTVDHLEMHVIVNYNATIFNKS